MTCKVEVVCHEVCRGSGDCLCLVADLFWVPFVTTPADFPVWMANVPPLPEGAEFRLAVMRRGAAASAATTVAEQGVECRRWPAAACSPGAVLRLRFGMETTQTLDAAAAAAAAAASRSAAAEIGPTCCICLDPLSASCCSTDRPLAGSAGDVPKLPTVCTLRCGHRFHTGCLSSHIATKTREAIEKVETELEPFMAAGLDIAVLRQQQRVRQCPRCGYGPVINQNCNDMTRHDAALGHGDGRTTNSCGKCGFFSECWEDWAVWDPAAPFTAALCPICKDACRVIVPQLSELQACFEEANRLLDALPGRLMRSLGLAVDFAVLLVQVRTELRGCTRALHEEDFEGLDSVIALGLVPEYFEGLLAGVLRHLLEERLTLEQRLQVQRQSVAQRAAEQGERLTGTNAAPGVRVHRGPDWPGGFEDECGVGRVIRVIASESGALVDVQWDSGCSGLYQAGEGFSGGSTLPSIRHQLALEPSSETLAGDEPGLVSACEALNRSILDCVLAGGSVRKPREEWIKEAVEKRRQSALLLCCIEDKLPRCVARSLGKPWSEASAEAAGLTGRLRICEAFLRAAARRQQASPVRWDAGLRARQIGELRLLRTELKSERRSALQALGLMQEPPSVPPGLPLPVPPAVPQAGPPVPPGVPLVPLPTLPVPGILPFPWTHQPWEVMPPQRSNDVYNFSRMMVMMQHGMRSRHVTAETPRLPSPFVTELLQGLLGQSTPNSDAGVDQWDAHRDTGEFMPPLVFY